jgi:hypothetical protein
LFPAEEKVRIVLSILAGEINVAEAARRAKVSEQSVGTGSAMTPEGQHGRSCRPPRPDSAPRREGRGLSSPEDGPPALLGYRD